jgi:hypothetical protein
MAGAGDLNDERRNIHALADGVTLRSVPHEFEPLLLAEHRALYNLLFTSASAALLEMAADVLEPAVVMVPHSWSVSRQHSPGDSIRSVGAGFSNPNHRFVAARQLDPTGAE